MGFGPAAARAKTDAGSDDERRLQRDKHGISAGVTPKEYSSSQNSNKILPRRREEREGEQKIFSGLLKQRIKYFLRDLCAFAVTKIFNSELSR
jgi:hypothetical protein